MVLKEKYLDEYVYRFGELGEPMKDLGRRSITIHLESDGIMEEFEVLGTGYDIDFLPFRGRGRIITILNEMGKYNIKTRISRERW